MTYTVGDRRISIDRDDLDELDQQLVLAHLELFKYCLNDACYNFLISMKRILHLYSDIITIYSTLLRKVPNYDDVTMMTNRTKLFLGKLEEDFNRLFGNKVGGDAVMKQNWEEKRYEGDVKHKSVACTESAVEMFEMMMKNLSCIELFFGNFDNLKKLLIPFLSAQTKAIHRLLVKALYLLRLTTIADEVGSIRELSPAIVKQLRKIEKITSGIERELTILDTAFATFDPSLKQYTAILLGKAILKRDIDAADCQLIRRREVCFQAAEHVVSIPLSEEQSSSTLMKHLIKYVVYAAIVFAVITTVIVHRLFKVLFST